MRELINSDRCVVSRRGGSEAYAPHSVRRDRYRSLLPSARRYCSELHDTYASRRPSGENAGSESATSGAGCNQRPSIAALDRNEIDASRLPGRVALVRIVPRPATDHPETSRLNRRPGSRSVSGLHRRALTRAEWWCRRVAHAGTRSGGRRATTSASYPAAGSLVSRRTSDDPTSVT